MVSGQKILQDGDMAGSAESQQDQKIAIANPQTAPYERQQKEALIKLKLWDNIQDKMVIAQKALPNPFNMRQRIWWTVLCAFRFR